MTKYEYEKSVFINCPFDEKYKLIFNAIIFTVSDCGYTPRCALEVQDSSSNRLNNILNIIKDCQFAIHDISRVTLDKKRFPRFNMPFELGLFVGAKHYGSKRHKNKSCLILDKIQYQYQKTISDIAGHDIKVHGDNIENIFPVIRDWLRVNSDIQIPGSAYIYNRYKKFQIDTPIFTKQLKLSTNIKDLDFMDYRYLVASWLNENN